MMMLLLLLLVVVVINVEGNNNNNNDYNKDDNFIKWYDNYKSYYQSKYDDNNINKIYNNYINNMKYINDFNSNKLSSYTISMNQFSGMDNDEFKKKILMNNNRKSSSSIPTSFDWRYNSNNNITVITEVKNQGSVGTCWAFSVVENIEGQNAITKNINAISLSVEYLVNCDGSFDPDSGKADCSIFGIIFIFLLYYYYYYIIIIIIIIIRRMARISLSIHY